MAELGLVKEKLYAGKPPFHSPRKREHEEALVVRHGWCPDSHSTNYKPVQRTVGKTQTELFSLFFDSNRKKKPMKKQSGGEGQSHISW